MNTANLPVKGGGKIAVNASPPFPHNEKASTAEYFKENQASNP